MKTRRKKTARKPKGRKTPAARRRTGTHARGGRTRTTTRGSTGVAEIALAYCVRRSPGAMEKLATLLGCTPGAIETLWRTIEGDLGTTTPSAKVAKQLDRVRETFGMTNRGKVEVANPYPRTESFGSLGCNSGCDQDTETGREFAGTYSLS